jgi:hypothetical protein
MVGADYRIVSVGSRLAAAQAFQNKPARRGGLRVTDGLERKVGDGFRLCGSGRRFGSWRIPPQENLL